MDVIPEPWAWAQLHFGSADLGDKRRTSRLVESAAKIAAHPEKAFTQVFDWNELRGFYRLCDQSQATLAAVMRPHWEQTRQAMRHHPVVLILHDTSELDYYWCPRIIAKLESAETSSPIGERRELGKAFCLLACEA